MYPRGTSRRGFAFQCGVNLFEGTTPAPTQAANSGGSVDLGEPDDAGVDIGSILGQSSKIWESMNKGNR